MGAGPGQYFHFVYKVGTAQVLLVKVPVYTAFAFAVYGTGNNAGGTAVEVSGDQYPGACRRVYQIHWLPVVGLFCAGFPGRKHLMRSEEHTSELQSRPHLV